MPFIQPHINREKHIIDATGKKPGRLASNIAILLQGKDKVIYERHWDFGDFVEVQNVAHMAINEKKLMQKNYYRSSGYLGGLKTIPQSRVFEAAPEKVLYMAVYRMLPKNSLRERQIKRLKIH